MAQHVKLLLVTLAFLTRAPDAAAKQCSTNASEKAVENGPSACIYATRVGDLGVVLKSWFQPGPDLTTATIWGVIQQRKILSLCLSAFQIDKQIFLKTDLYFCD